MLQPRPTNSVASQSSSSGWVGSWPWRPKSLGVATIPTEVPLPDTIDHHPGRERMIGLAQPERELLAVTRNDWARALLLDLRCVKNRREPGGDLLLRHREFAAVEHVDFGNELRVAVAEPCGHGHVGDSVVASALGVLFR